MMASKWLDAIAAERQRQVDKLGYDAANDRNEEHQDGELAQAACFMAWPRNWIGVGLGCRVDLLFPETWNPLKHSYRQGKTPQERLIVAGALILAELERLEAGQNVDGESRAMDTDPPCYGNSELAPPGACGACNLAGPCADEEEARDE